MNAADTYRLQPIGYVRSCYREKFGAPRQPGLAPASTAEIILVPPYDDGDMLRGLEGCSHIWVLFVFHRNADRGWSPTVRPPRLGGNRRMGVFATRSPFRPNPIGMSVVELRALLGEPESRGLLVANHDLVDGTPVLDIKPYVPYSDAVPDARAPVDFRTAPARTEVDFSPPAEQALAHYPPGFATLIVDTLSLDPRPAYRGEEDARSYGAWIGDADVRWRMVGGRVYVESVHRRDE